MKRSLISSFAGIGLFLAMAGTFIHGQAQSDGIVWKEFVNMLLENKMTLDRIRPVTGASAETLMGYLNKIKEKASRKELDVEPKFYRVENMLHFIVPLSFEGSKIDYCFSFLMDDHTWYFYALEAIFLRLDNTPPPPVSKFPDIPENQKAVHREEIRTRDLVYQFNYFRKEKGKEFALNWPKDGYGYFASAKIRVPFLPPSRAFILFLCWDQANLMGNNVTLEKLTDREAVVRIETIYFYLYHVSTHLKDQIAFDDYRQIFEAIWQDRAEKAGWKLNIEYEGSFPGAICIFRFSK